MLSRDLTQVVGDIIGRCGTVELLINVFIELLGRDSLLIAEITRLPLARRIRVLRGLLLNRTTFSPSEINSLCDDLKNVAEDRNVIAHNPILADNDGGNGRILVNRGKHRSGLTEFNEGELDRVQEQAVVAIEKLADAMNRVRSASVK